MFQSPRLDLPQLLDLLHELRAIETGIKTGRTDKPYAGLHWLVADVCGRKEPA